MAFAVDTSLPTTTLRSFNELILQLYKGAYSSSPWQEFLAHLRQLTAAQTAVLALRRPFAADLGVAFIDAGRIGEDGRQRFAQDFSALNPFVDLPDGEPMTLAERVPATELQQSEYFRRYMAPTDQTQVLGLDIHRDGEARLFLRAIRGSADAPFSAQDKALFQLLVEHLRELLVMLNRDCQLQSQQLVLEGTLNRLAMGSVLLDAEQRILKCSPVAEHLLQLGDGLRQLHGRLQAVQHSDNLHLQELIQSCSSLDAPLTPQAISLERRQHLQPLHLILRPLPRGEFYDSASSPRVALLISAPELRAEMPEELLQQLFELTPQEARLVVRLANGLTLDDIAEEMNISRNTVRTHLHNAFQKTGTKQQSALVSLVFRSISGLG